MNAEGNNHSGLKKKFVKSPNHINFHLHTHTILFKMDRKKNETGPANKTQAHKLVCLFMVLKDWELTWTKHFITKSNINYIHIYLFSWCTCGIFAVF